MCYPLNQNVFIRDFDDFDGVNSGLIEEQVRCSFTTAQ